MMLDLTGEVPRMALILLECLYLGRYTGYEKDELRSLTQAEALLLEEYFHYRIYLLGERWAFPGLQAFAWNRMLQCRWLLDQENQRPDQPFAQQEQGQNTGFKGKTGQNCSENPIIIEKEVTPMRLKRG